MSLAIRRAVYGKLAGDVTLVAMLNQTPPTGYAKSIYYQQAPANAGFPYVIFSKMSGVPRYAIGARAFDNDIWLVKGVVRADPKTAGSADTVDNIASRLDALLTDGTLSISGKTQLHLRRDSDVDYPEEADGVIYQHAGSTFRLIYE